MYRIIGLTTSDDTMNIRLYDCATQEIITVSKTEAESKKLDMLPTFEKNILMSRGNKEYYALQALMDNEYKLITKDDTIIKVSDKECFNLAKKEQLINMQIINDELVFLDKSRESEQYLDITDDTITMSYIQGEESVVIPSYIRRIGAQAFKGTTIKYLRLNNVEVIEDSAFAYSGVSIIDCRGLLRVIGAEAFHNCEELSFVRGLQSIQQIGDRAFANCKKLQYFPFNQIKSLNISFGEQCFRNTVLLNLNLDACVKSIEIKKRAFKNCAFLTEISLKGSAAIADYAFYGCKSLKHASIRKATDIGTYAFGGTRRLKQLEIPSNIHIHSTAFEGSSPKFRQLGII